MPAAGAAIAMLTRAPEPGRTKSRLAAAIGDEAAAALHRAFLRDEAAAVRSAGPWHAALFVEPPAATEELAAFTGITDARPQGTGHIGLRMLHAQLMLAARGFAPIVVVGSDVPTLQPARLHQALRALRRADVVLGPAADGGYYLIGTWKPRAALFDDRSLRWGGGEIFATTERIAHDAGLSTTRLPIEHDIDRPEDLEWLRERIAALEANGEPLPTYTLAALRALA